MALLSKLIGLVTFSISRSENVASYCNTCSTEENPIYLFYLLLRLLVCVNIKKVIFGVVMTISWI